MRALALTFDVDQYGSDPVARVVVFRSRLFAADDDPFGPSQVDDHVAAVETLDLAGQQFADAIRVLVPHQFAFGLFDFLINDLLGRLCRDAGQRCFCGVVRRLEDHADLDVALKL